MSGVEVTAADNEAAASYLAAMPFGSSKAQYLARWQEKDKHEDGYVHPLAYLFAQTRIQARNAALEDAARVADDNRTDDGRMWDKAAEAIAEMIRKLT